MNEFFFGCLFFFNSQSFSALIRIYKHRLDNNLSCVFPPENVTLHRRSAGHAYFRTIVTIMTKDHDEPQQHDEPQDTHPEGKLKQGDMNL